MTLPIRRSATTWTTIAIAVAVAMLALFNARSPRDWSANLPPGPASLVLRRAADDWWTTTERWGLGRPRDVVSRLWAEAKDVEWRRRVEGAAEDQR